MNEKRADSSSSGDSPQQGGSDGGGVATDTGGAGSQKPPDLAGAPPLGEDGTGTATCQACGRVGVADSFKWILHQRVVLNANKDDILGVEKSPEINCTTCLAWLDMNVEFYLCVCEEGEEN